MPSLKLSNPFRQGADRPSLRDRAASLKATAGRVMRRKPADRGTAAIIPAPGGADAEIVALASAFCDAYARNGRADRKMMAGRATEMEWKPYYDATARLMAEMEEAEPTTMLGMAMKCLVLAGSLAWQLNAEPSGDDRNDRIARQFEDAMLAGNLVPLDGPAGGSTAAWETKSAPADRPASADALATVPLDSLFALADLYWNASRHFHVAAFWPKIQAGAKRPGQDIAIHEGDRLSDLFAAVVAEMARREPRDETEADQRREWQVRCALDCGDGQGALLILRDSPALAGFDAAEA